MRLHSDQLVESDHLVVGHSLDLEEVPAAVDRLYRLGKVLAVPKEMKC